MLEQATVAAGKSTLSIWIVTDNKPGHLNQLKGLCERIAAHRNTNEHWLSVEEINCSWLDCLLGRYKTSAQTAPDIVIGAGHRTHKAILAIKRTFNCFAVVLMKPSLPVSWFNASIIPEHDNPAERSQTLITKGVLNTISPMTVTPESPFNHKGLILIGGESKHYHWTSQEIAQQVLQLVHRQPDTQWLLSDSRRTPSNFMSLLSQLLPTNLVLVPHTETPAGWVKQQMMQTAQIWVTPDSVSMVYEALTSGVPTGLFKMSPNKEGRIVKGIQTLCNGGVVTEFSADDKAQRLPSSVKPLWESERAAIWLLKQYDADTISRAKNREKQ